MTHDECKAIKELFETKFEEQEKLMDVKFKAFDKRTDRMIESFNGKNEMTDARITRGCDKTGKIETRLGEVEKVQAVRISRLTQVIAALAIGATLAAQKIWAHLFSA